MDKPWRKSIDILLPFYNSDTPLGYPSIAANAFNS